MTRLVRSLSLDCQSVLLEPQGERPECEGTS